MVSRLAASGVPHASTDVAPPRSGTPPPADRHGDSLPLPPLVRYTIYMTLHVTKTAPHLRGLWVALADDRETVLGSGKTAEEALAKTPKKRPETLILTHLPADDEIPNDDLIAAMREGEEEDRAGNLKGYKTVDSFLASLR